MQALVSVIMPCHNAMPFLTEALDSIIRQTYKNLEIILINDGSTDLTPVILDHYAKNDSRIRYLINEKNLGLIETLNRGILTANGEYIARMDADDISDPLRIEILVNEIIERKADVISCGSLLIDKTGRTIAPNPVRATEPLSCSFFSFFGPPVLHPGVLVKTDLLKENLYKKSSSTIHTEDYELWGRLVRQGKKIVNSEKSLLKYRISDQSISRKFEEVQIRNFIDCAYQHYEKFFSISPNYKVLKVMVNRIDRTISPVHLIKGFSLVSQTKSRFLRKQTRVSKKERNEIRIIVQQQKLDVIIQSFKRGRFLLKISSFFLFLFMIPQLAFNNHLRDYFYFKIHYNIKTRFNF